MSNAIEQGDGFSTKVGKCVHAFRRETDDAAPLFACERIRVTHVSNSDDAKHLPYTFGAEPEWFAQRGLIAA